MCSLLRWCVLSVLVLLLAVPSALAANTPVASEDAFKLTPVSTSCVLPASLRPMPAPTVEAPATQLPPVQLARVPSYALSTSTLLAAGTQPIGFQGGGGWGNRHVQWAVYGAAIGLVVGLIDDGPVEKALIGGIVGFGLSYVVRY